MGNFERVRVEFCALLCKESGVTGMVGMPVRKKDSTHLLSLHANLFKGTEKITAVFLQPRIDKRNPIALFQNVGVSPCQHNTVDVFINLLNAHG